MPSTPSGRIGEANKNLVLNEVRRRGVVSVDELVRHTGRSQPTILKWLNALEREGYLQRAGFGDSRGGRPPALYRFRRERGYVLGVALEVPSVKAAVLDLSGRPVASRTLAADLESGPRSGLESLSDSLLELVDEAGVDRGSLIGAGVALSGFIDREGGRWLATPRLPGWQDVPVRSTLEERLGVPVAVNHHIDALTLAELSYGETGWPDFIYFDIGFGLGVRLVRNGVPSPGSFGNAGNIGHTTVVPDGRTCLCGNRGCLEEYVSGRALLREYPAGVGQDLNGEPMEEVNPLARQLFADAEAGEAAATRITGELMSYLSIGVANVVNLFDLPRIVVNGFVTEGGKELRSDLLGMTRRRLQPTLADAIQIQFSSAPRAVAGPFGAALFALRNHFPFVRPLVTLEEPEGGGVLKKPAIEIRP